VGIDCCGNSWFTLFEKRECLRRTQRNRRSVAGVWGDERLWRIDRPLGGERKREQVWLRYNFLLVNQSAGEVLQFL